MSTNVRLLVSDVDGTLLSSQKVLTEESIRAVKTLADAGIIFAITSARPPQGLTGLIEPLRLSTPIGAFNGALIVDGDMQVLEEKTIDDDVAAPIIDLLHSHDLSVWVYQGARWFVLNENGPHIEHESRGCDCRPTMLRDFGSIEGGITKVVGVSDDAHAGAGARSAINVKFASRVSATQSQSYFLDVTHPDANKGRVVRYLADIYGVDETEIATIGDMHNDVSMFLQSGLSIAMGNADAEVKEAASKVTKSNDDEGFAHAVHRIVLER